MKNHSYEVSVTWANELVGWAEARDVREPNEFMNFTSRFFKPVNRANYPHLPAPLPPSHAAYP